MRLPPSINDWPEDARHEYEERAGIREFQGNAPRHIAEREAEEEVRAKWGNGFQKSFGGM